MSANEINFLHFEPNTTTFQRFKYSTKEANVFEQFFLSNENT